MLMLVCGLAFFGQKAQAQAQDNVTFTNLTLTFTNLQGTTYSNATLLRADLDGIIWRSEGSGGRICFTNLAPEFLAKLGIPEARIDVAALRAAHKAVSDAQYRAARDKAAQDQVQAQKAAKEKQAAQERADAPRKERNAQMQKDLAEIQRLTAQIVSDIARRDALWDYYVHTDDNYTSVTVGSRGGSADTAATRLANARAIDRQLELERQTLATLRAAFEAKYGSASQ